MYKIDRSSNKVIKLQECTFSELGFREREHLQEWIAKDPAILGEELLVIQKEFSGFSDTQERLDLLALDKDRSLVVIENKLDDSGRDVTWQALKYASYCSGLSKDNIRKIYQDYLDKLSPGQKAEDNLSEFFDGVEYEDLSLNRGVTQRIILIAAQFRKEVTSTVLWLLNFKVRLQCFKATPYSMDDQLFLSAEQIIPTPDAEEYMIGMAEKAQEDVESQAELRLRKATKQRFWAKLIPRINAVSSLFQNINPSTARYIGTSAGVRGVSLNFGIGRSFARVDLYIDRGDKDENEFIYSELAGQKNQIERDFGSELIWQPLEGKRACRIKAEAPGNVFEEDQWDTMIDFMVKSMADLELALKSPLSEINQKIG